MPRVKRFTAPRPYYYVFEQITRERVERGDLVDDAPKRLVLARTPVVVESHWLTPATGRFVNQNYLSVGAVRVLGKKIASPAVGHVGFEIAIPESYTLVGLNGRVSGTLDGTEINGPRDLAAGPHDLAAELSGRLGGDCLVACDRERVFSVWPGQKIELSF